jgi:hypothetical protein
MQAHEDSGESGNAPEARERGVIVLDVSSAPPSLNTMDYRSNWRHGRRVKQAWMRDLGMLMLSEQLPKGLSRVDATAVVRFPTRRRRDEGNYRAMLEKALGDVLVDGGWLPDDTPDRYRFGGLEFDEEPGPARTLVQISYEKETR